MEEESLKRNTDCVYFLASPLTCKKGLECEYRHSETARLNPRDCWYWLAGNCLNPTCAFRHPPLDVHTEVSSESVPLPHQFSVPVNKTNAPCYFYFNGFCNKGDKCSFLHGPDGSSSGWKSLNTASATTDALPLENKTSAGSNTGSAPIEAHPSSSHSAPKTAVEMQFQHKDDLQQSAPDNVQEESASLQRSASEYDEAAAIRLDSFLPAEGFIKSRSLVCTDQSSEEQVDGLIDPEERWESSPGFDVLVDDGSENLDYEDDPDHVMALDREGRDLNSHFLGYDYEDLVEYNPTYPDAGILHERGIYDSFDRLENDHDLDYIRNVPGRSRETTSDPTFPRKRKFMHAEGAVHGRSSVDLRNRLRKRRVIDGHPANRFSRRHNSSRLIGRIQEWSRRHGEWRLHGRLVEVGSNFIEALGENETLPNGVNQRGWYRSRQQHKERKQTKQGFLSSEVLRKPVSRKKRSTQETTSFTGPKTLAQIKEEKGKTRENKDCFGKMGHSSRSRTEYFQGPKPLSEILKDKKRLGSVIECNINCS